MDQGQAVETERLSRAMETTRASIRSTVGELRDIVTRAVDWREHIKIHPGAALGVAATGGMLLGRWLGEKIPARANRSGSPSRPPAENPAFDGTRPPTSVRTLLDGSWTRAGSRVGELVNRVIDELGDTVETTAIPPLIARVRSFLQPSTKAGGQRRSGPADSWQPRGEDASSGSRDAGARFAEPGVYPGGPAGRQSYPPHAGEK